MIRSFALAGVLSLATACNCTEIGWVRGPALYIYFADGGPLPADHYEVLVEYSDYSVSCEVDLPSTPDSAPPLCGDGTRQNNLYLSGDGTTLDQLALGGAERRVTVTVRGASGEFERTEVLHTDQVGGGSAFECNAPPGHRTAWMEL